MGNDAWRSRAEGEVVPGRRAVLELLQASASTDRILIADGVARSPVMTELRRRARDAAIPTRTVPRAELDRLAGGLNHQGVVAITASFPYTSFSELLTKDVSAVLFLDGVMDPHNLGSLVRSAEVAGFDGVVIRARRAAGVTSTVRKVSAGATEILPVARVGNLAHSLDQARGAGLWIVGLDERADDTLWSSNLMEPPVGVVLGAEDRGMSKAARDRCDGVVRIPHKGKIASLNVGVAGALAMFEVARRRELVDAPSR